MGVHSVIVTRGIGSASLRVDRRSMTEVATSSPRASDVRSLRTQAYLPLPYRRIRPVLRGARHGWQRGIT